MIVLVSQVNVLQETVIAPKDSAHLDNLTTADRAQKVNAPLETLRRVLPAIMRRVHPVITSLALPAAMMMISNPVPMPT
jgi:hypothetical protein